MDDLQQIVNVARMYYQQGLKQEDIAKKVKISRASVSLILTEARRKGIVEITIRNPLEDDAELSTLFRGVSPEALPRGADLHRETDILIDLTASRAAEVFNEEAKRATRWGLPGAAPATPSCPPTSPRLPAGHARRPAHRREQPNLKRYQLNEMVRLFAEKLKGTPTFIHAPALPTSQDDYSCT